MDEACQSVIDRMDNWHIASSAIWVLLATIYILIFVFIAVKFFRARAQQRASGFSYAKYLSLLGIAMFFISISDFVLGLGGFFNNPPKSANIAQQYFGSKFFAAWQFLYTSGQCFLVASKILVLVRLLEFSGKSSQGISPQKINFIRLLLWFIFVVYAIVCVISAAILFFDALSSQTSVSLFETLTAVIVLARCFTCISLAIVFMYGGYTRCTLTNCNCLTRSHLTTHLFLSHASPLALVTVSSVLLSIRVTKLSTKPLDNAAAFSKHHEKLLSDTKKSVRVFLLKLQISTAWNAFFFCVVFTFNILVGVGLGGLKGSYENMCSYEQPAVTRLLPFLVINPFAASTMNFCAEGVAALLTLWAMAPTFQKVQMAGESM